MFTWHQCPFKRLKSGLVTTMVMLVLARLVGLAGFAGSAVADEPADDPLRDISRATGREAMGRYNKSGAFRVVFTDTLETPRLPDGAYKAAELLFRNKVRLRSRRRRPPFEYSPIASLVQVNFNVFEKAIVRESRGRIHSTLLGQFRRRD